MKVYGIAGWKNSGKTGLVERLVTHFNAQGLTVSTLKHAHHAAQLDRPGKDSFRHRAAGARQVLVSSARRWALLTELTPGTEPPLADLLTRLDPVDLVLIEGWKGDAHPKIEAVRPATGQPFLAPQDPTIRAIAAEGPAPATDRPVFDLNDTAGIAGFIAQDLGL